MVSKQAGDPIGGLIVMPNVFNTTNRELIVAMAARYSVPAIYFSAYCAQSDGLAEIDQQTEPAASVENDPPATLAGYSPACRRVLN